MSVLHDEESHASEETERKESSPSLSAEERELFHELLHVLKRLASAKGLSGADDAEIATNAEADKIEDTKVTVLPARNDQETVGDGWKQEHKEIKSSVGFEKLCDDHGQLVYRIQTSLNALGGGGRTAKALQRMAEAVVEIRGLFIEYLDKTLYFRLYAVKKVFGNYKEAALEAKDAFKELGVFNTNFFDAIETILRRLETMTARFDVEYGSEAVRLVDVYLDSLFEPLIEDFESFLRGLTNIVEKEISAIRQSQNFTSQRYLNLTTVATFLSSVTATTLQTTVDDSDSPLWSAINTLWFISLDFSMASAVYSLLVMTWRQSSVCKPDLSLPSTLKIWLLNGPMYTLIASVLTFSIGLSLFAYRSLRQQVGLASAVVPTTLAGILASSVLLFSAWFLFELWKAKHNENWVMVQNRYLIPIMKFLEKAVVMAMNSVHLIGQCAKRSTTAFKTVTVAAFSIRNSKPSSGSDEKVRTDIEAAPPQIPPEKSQDVPALESHKLDSISEPELEAANPEQALATPEMIPATVLGDSETNEGNVDQSIEDPKYEPFQDVLQFSPDGRFLASAHSDTVVIYDVQNSFSIFSTIKDPDASQIKQVEWQAGASPRVNLPGFVPKNPENILQFRDKEGLEGELLVRSSKGLSTWSIQYSPANARMSGHLTEVVAPVHWIGLDDAGIIGFITSTESSVRLFDKYCNEVPNRSIDVCKLPNIPDISEMFEMSKVKHVIDAIFYQNKYIFCLARLAESVYDKFLVIDLDAKKVESHRDTQTGHKRMIFSPAANRVLFVGSKIKYGVEIAELSILSSEDGLNVSIRTCQLHWRANGSHELERPEQAVTFHGNDDSMIIGYSSGEILALHKPKHHPVFKALHIFTTRAEEAIPKSPVNFSVSPWGWSDLYLFAFADKRGFVTVCSVQSNEDLSDCKSAKAFVVEDRRDGRWRSPPPVISPGRYLVLPPPTVHDSAGQSSQQAH